MHISASSSTARFSLDGSVWSDGNVYDITGTDRRYSFYVKDGSFTLALTCDDRSMNPASAVYSVNPLRPNKRPRLAFGAVFMLTIVSDAGVKSSKKSSPRANDNGRVFLSLISPVNTGPKFYSVTHGHRNISVNTDGSNNNPLLSEPFSTDLGISVVTVHQRFNPAENPVRFRP